MKKTGVDLHGRATWHEVLLYAAAAVLVPVAIGAIFLVAPTEQTMGEVQRIVYVHVAVAWLALLGLIVMGGSGVAYLTRRNLACDTWAQAAGELGWLCGTLTLITGSFWAHAAWGTWWTWDPRLTTSFILWAIYSGCLIVRANIESPHRRARIGAILAIVGLLDVPLVLVASRWFRGIHPATPGMEPTMRIVLLISVVAFTTIVAVLLLRRRTQLSLENQLNLLQQQIEP